MSEILHIETSGKNCSVALSKGKNLVNTEIIREDRSHAASLTIMIDKVLKTAGKKIKDIDAVSVSAGPGSYTGLRIGVSVSKAICYASELPMIAVPTLKILLVHLFRHADRKHIMNNDRELFVPMIDARRKEVYQAIYDRNFNQIEKVSPLILDENSYSDYLNNYNMLFFGNGANKTQDIISHPNALFVSNIEPEAKDMIPLACEKYDKKDFEDTAYYEPFYLKEFQATKPRKKIL